jgi:hypothetical protein
MNDVLASRCCTAYDAAIHSSIGLAVVSRLSSSFPNSVTALEDLRSRLENSEFASPLDWYQNIESIFKNLARDVGIETDFGLSILTLLQMVTDRLEPVLGQTTKPEPGCLDQLISDLKHYTQTAPNNLREFIAASRPPTVRPEVPPIMIDGMRLESEDSTPLDVKALYQNLMNLQRDEDLERICDIVSRHETKFKHVRRMIQIDLGRCQPYTLRLIQKYIASLEPAA